MSEPDYITIIAAVKHSRWNVVWMRANGDDYYVFRISPPMSRLVADALAKSWAAQGRLEIR